MSKFRAGDLLHVTRAASPQFINPIMFRVIRVIEEWTKTAFDGWIWLEGYQLDDKGDAVARRSIFVMKDGLVIQRRTAPVVAPQRRSIAPQRR